MSKSWIPVLLLVASVLAAQPRENIRLEISIVQSIGGPGDGNGQFQYPNGLDVAPTGILYVADTGNNRIQSFDANGSFLTQIGGFGWNSEQFQQPMDICCRNALDVYVADKENNRIERYDKDLHWITSLYSDPSADENLQFALPISLGMNMHGELYVLDREYNRAIKFNSSFEPILRFADFDWGDGALKTPGHIHVSEDDLVYISDMEKGCVNLYDGYGNYLHNIGLGVLSAPTGVCNGPSGLVLVVDNDLDQMLIFEKSGRFVQAMGSNGDKYGAFNNPGDIACFNNQVYIADTGNHRIQVFKIRVLQ